MTLASQSIERSISKMQTISNSVAAVTASRVLHVMPRLTHHNSAHPISTGTMKSSCTSSPSLSKGQRQTPTLPPSQMQVADPSILTKPEPHSAHGLTAAFGRSGRDVAALPGFARALAGRTRMTQRRWYHSRASLLNRPFC
jgi:hypothetical protein